jgi:Zn-finger nucleic acid-binding protein
MAMIRKAGSMAKYRLICPECSAAVITTYPEASVWEVCPGCRRHVWDLFDAQLADKIDTEPSRSAGRSTHAEN